MNGQIKAIVGALVIVLLGLLLTPTVVMQVQNVVAVQTCPTAAGTPIASEVKVALTPEYSNVPNATYRAGALCGQGAGGTKTSYTSTSDGTAIATSGTTVRKATKLSGGLAYDQTGAKEINNLVTVFWVLGVLGGAVGFIYIQFRNASMV